MLESHSVSGDDGMTFIVGGDWRPETMDAGGVESSSSSSALGNGSSSPSSVTSTDRLGSGSGANLIFLVEIGAKAGRL